MASCNVHGSLRDKTEPFRPSVLVAAMLLIGVILTGLS